jgi:hypothetical protein
MQAFLNTSRSMSTSHQLLLLMEERELNSFLLLIPSKLLALISFPSLIAILMVKLRNTKSMSKLLMRKLPLSKRSFDVCYSIHLDIFVIM